MFQAFLLCAFPALSPVLLASGEETASPLPAGSTGERATPALFFWGDVDGDGRLELAAVSAEGKLQLLRNTEAGRFEDATDASGLSGIDNAALAAWEDYDGDGRVDLFVGARQGKSRLFRNEGGVFIDMTAGSGLSSEGAVQSAHWLDHDGDGWLDLHIVTAERNELFRGLEGGFFEVTELPLTGAANAPEAMSVPFTDVNEKGVNGTDGLETTVVSSSANSRRDGGPIRGSVKDVERASGRHFAPALTGCAASLADQSSLQARCLTASTIPALGMLYPLSANLFVAVGGNVGIGTTTPAAKLDVAGTVRMTDTLTLAPGGDQALDVSTGSIYKGGALFIHTRGGGGVGGNTALGRNALSNATTGYHNTASGYGALFNNTSGHNNTACGVLALDFNTTGYRNTACGAKALLFNTTGTRNTATGYRALALNTIGINNTASGYLGLHFNTTGSFNTAGGDRALSRNTAGLGNEACGAQALYNNTTGNFNSAGGGWTLFRNTTGLSNTACGALALYSNTTGSRNIALGRNAGYNLTTGHDNIAIGNPGVAGEGSTIRIGGSTHRRAFIAGIRGVTTGNANGIPVLVDSAGQLGTVSSSRRFKEEIRDMGDLTDRLLALRPVVFRYKPEVQSGERPLEYGLIAEEVAEVFPDLVVHDEEGKPFTVKYHVLSSMLLNEMKKQNERFEAQGERLQELEARLAALETQASRTTRAAGGG